MNLDWLAPAFDEAKQPFIVSRSDVRRIAIGLSAYSLFVLFPAYVALRYFWGGYELSWAAIGWACGASLLIGWFADLSMWRLLFVAARGKKAMSISSA